MASLTSSTTVTDAVNVSSRSGSDTFGPNYGQPFDLNCDGAINDTDLSAVVGHIGTLLPSGEPSLDPNPTTGTPWLFTEDFDDGAAGLFAPQSGTWFVNGIGRYRAEPAPAPGTDAVSLLTPDEPLPAAFRVGATIRGRTGAAGTLKNAVLVFDYRGPDDFKFAGGFFGADQWRIGHVAGGAWVTDASVARVINTQVDYNVVLVIEGERAVLSVGGVEMVRFDFQTATDLRDGLLGLGTHNAVAVFDDLVVEESVAAAALPHVDDFNDGVARDFTPVQGVWFVNQAGRYRAEPFDSASNAISLLPPGHAIATDLQIDVTMRGKDGPAGSLKNALLIFDYHGPDDFKFAGGFFGAGQWRIGHVAGGAWTTDVSVGQAIRTDVDYDVRLRVTGSLVTLQVSGAEKLSFDFAGDTPMGGRIGLGTRRAVATFDDFAVRGTPP